MSQKLKMLLICRTGNQQHQGVGYERRVRGIEVQSWHETHVQSANMIQTAYPGMGNGNA